jgi:hypothetical protein
MILPTMILPVSSFFFAGRPGFFRKKTIPDMCGADEEKKGTWAETKRHEARTDRFPS